MLLKYSGLDAILAGGSRDTRQIIDNIERDNEVKKTKRESLFEEETISQATKAKKSLSDETREWKLQGRTGDA